MTIGILILIVFIIVLNILAIIDVIRNGFSGANSASIAFCIVETIAIIGLIIEYWNTPI